MGVWTEAEARRQLASFEQSNLSLAAWSAQAGVSPQRVYYWRDRLRATTPEPEPGVRLVEVAMRPAPTGHIEVQFPTGHLLRVPVGVGVADVVRAVGLGPC